MHANTVFIEQSYGVYILLEDEIKLSFDREFWYSRTGGERMEGDEHRDKSSRKITKRRKWML